MTREKEIEKAANKYANEMVTSFPATIKVCFAKGAEWADKTTLDKIKSLIKEWEHGTSAEAKYKVEAYKDLMEIIEIEKEDKE